MKLGGTCIHQSRLSIKIPLLCNALTAGGQMRVPFSGGQDFCHLAQLIIFTVREKHIKFNDLMFTLNGAISL